MGAWYPSATTVRGIRGDLEQRLNEIPQIWPNHVTRVGSTTKVEPFAWSGAVPKPRLMADGRKLQGLGQFSFNIENLEYELSVLIDKVTFEDQQTSDVQRKIVELSLAWGPFKDEILAEMLEAGAGTTKGSAYDGAAFFGDSRTEGDSGTIDNNTTSVAAGDDAVPTSAEFLAAMNAIINQMALFGDDKGRKGTNRQAMSQLRVMAEKIMTRPILEALQSTLIANTDNVFGRGLAIPDFSEYMTPDQLSTPTTTMYVHAVGDATFRGIIYQERGPLEMEIFDDPHWMTFNNGLLITLRQRFAFAYGNFRRMVKHVFTT